MFHESFLGTQNAASMAFAIKSPFWNLYFEECILFSSVQSALYSICKHKEMYKRIEILGHLPAVD